MHTYTANLARSNKRKYLAAYFEARDAWNSLPALLSLSLLGSASVLELTEHKIIIRNQISAEIWTPSQFEADQAQLPLLFPCETPWLPTAALGVVIKRKIEKQRAKKLRMGKCEQQAKGESQVKNYVISRARKKVCNAFWFSCHSDAHKLAGAAQRDGGRRNNVTNAVNNVYGTATKKSPSLYMWFMQMVAPWALPQFTNDTHDLPRHL